MADEAKFGSVRSLRPVVRAAFGDGVRLTAVERLAGGSKKGAYLARMSDASDNASTALVYVWDPAEDYWDGALPAEAADPAEPFSHASGLELFEAAANRLTAVGVRCPRIVFADRSRELYPADIAVVEYVPGGSLQTLLEQDPQAAGPALDVLAGWLDAMAAYQAPMVGKVAFVDARAVEPRAPPPARRSSWTAPWPTSPRSRGAIRAWPPRGIGSKRRCASSPRRSNRVPRQPSYTASSAPTTC